MVVNPRPGDNRRFANRFDFGAGADSDHFFSAGPLDPRHACSGILWRLLRLENSFESPYAFAKTDHLALDFVRVEQKTLPLGYEKLRVEFGERAKRDIKEVREILVRPLRAFRRLRRSI